MHCNNRHCNRTRGVYIDNACSTIGNAVYIDRQGVHIDNVDATIGSIGVGIDNALQRWAVRQMVAWKMRDLPTQEGMVESFTQVALEEAQTQKKFSDHSSAHCH